MLIVIFLCPLHCSSYTIANKKLMTVERQLILFLEFPSILFNFFDRYWVPIEFFQFSIAISRQFGFLNIQLWQWTTLIHTNILRIKCHHERSNIKYFIIGGIAEGLGGDGIFQNLNYSTLVLYHDTYWEAVPKV